MNISSSLFDESWDFIKIRITFTKKFGVSLRFDIKVESDLFKFSFNIWIPIDILLAYGLWQTRYLFILLIFFLKLLQMQSALKYFIDLHIYLIIQHSILSSQSIKISSKRIDLNFHCFIQSLKLLDCLFVLVFENVEYAQD